METIGRYRILRRLAIGGMAEIFLAEEPGLAEFSRQVAIKRILPHRANDQEFVRMFLNEARLVALLNHPNIVEIYDLGEAEGHHYIAMEYVEGFDFGQILDRFEQKHGDSGTRLPEPFVAHLMMQACAGLYYAHSFRDSRTGQHLGLIHRDISLPNVMVSLDGMVKVLDFGIAKATEQARDIATQAGVLKGKISYMSPEYLVGEQIDARHDIFALGVVCYEMLTGQKPFRARGELQMMQAIIGQEPQDPRQFNRELSNDLGAILMRMLAKEPARRYQTGADVEAALQQWLQRFAPDYTLTQAVEYLYELFDISGGPPTIATPPSSPKPRPGLSRSVLPENPEPPRIAPATNPMISSQPLREPEEITGAWRDVGTSPGFNPNAQSQSDPWDVPTSYLTTADIPDENADVEMPRIELQQSRTDPQATRPLDMELVERAKRGEPPTGQFQASRSELTDPHAEVPLTPEATPESSPEIGEEPEVTQETPAPEAVEEDDDISLLWGIFPLLFVVGLAAAWFGWKWYAEQQANDEPLPVARLSDASSGRVLSLNDAGTPKLPPVRVPVRVPVRPPVRVPVRRVVKSPPRVGVTDAGTARPPERRVADAASQAIPVRRPVPRIVVKLPVIRRAVIVRNVPPRRAPIRRAISIVVPRRRVVRRPVAVKPRIVRGELKLRSIPSCTVYANNRRLGRTPISMALLPGKHRFLLRRSRPYIRLPIRVEIKAGDKIRRTLRIRQGRLKIEVQGGRSRVYVDGNYIGTTPVPSLRLYAGFHTIQLRSSSGRRRTRRVYIYSGRRSSIRLRAP